MIIYLDYLNKDEYRKYNGCVQVGDSIFNSDEEAIRYLITEELGMDESLVCSYEINGRYQLLPKNPEGESRYFRFNKKTNNYELCLCITNVIDFTNKKELLRIIYTINSEDGKVSSNSLSSTSLGEVIDLLRVELYKLGISKYNSNISVKVEVEPTIPNSSTFSVKPYKSDNGSYGIGFFLFEKGVKEDELEVIDSFKSDLKSVIKSSVTSAFGDYNPEINLDNLSVSINYGDE